MRLDWRFFAIAPSIWISSLCYSIFRIEPYTICSYGCIYCYARWYRSGIIVNKRTILKAWRKLAFKLYKLDLPPPYFRLSTLIEPFQEHLERKQQISLEIMQEAIKCEIPLVINTKSTLLVESPWIDKLLALTDKGLALVQISLTTVNQRLSKELEPKAPDPRKRLKVIEELREHDIPVVTRIQPLIPGIEMQQLDAAKEALNHGSLGIIVEPIRETVSGLEKIAKAIGITFSEYFSKYRWEPYTFSPKQGGLLRPGLDWRKNMYRRLKDLTLQFGREMTLCKDGVWTKYSHPGLDCCQTWHIKAQYAIRKTLHEYISRLQKGGSSVYLIKENEFVRYPRFVKRALMLHHNKLRRVLETRDILVKLVVYDR